jgi:dTDP-glucose 4,6-dehydratase
VCGPRHDRCFAIDSSFAQRELKWKPLHHFKEGLESTIDWYINNRTWWEPLLELRTLLTF